MPANVTAVHTTAFLGLCSPTYKLINSINSSMAESQDNLLQPISQALSYLIYLNVEFGVLVCLGSGCCKAVSAKDLVEHLYKYHNKKPQVRKQVKEYVKAFLHEYNYKTIIVPIDRNTPQTNISVVDGFRYQHCRYSTKNWRTMKDHRNKQHSIKRVEDNELFQPVRLQT
jgi:hypothetical protein